MYRGRMTSELHDLSSELVVYAARLIRTVRRRHDLPPGFRVLSMLDEHGDVGVTRLAELDGCSQPTMSATVTGLVDRGWVTKSPRPGDARASDVSLTDAGRTELTRARAANADTVAALVAASGHTADDVATAVAVLRDLLEAPDAPRRRDPSASIDQERTS